MNKSPASLAAIADEIAAERRATQPSATQELIARVLIGRERDSMCIVRVEICERSAFDEQLAGWDLRLVLSRYGVRYWRDQPLSFRMTLIPGDLIDDLIIAAEAAFDALQLGQLRRVEECRR